MDTQQQTPTPEPPIESASGTTDHANNHGSAFAYGITALCLGILILLGTAIGGCVGAVAQEALYYDYGSYGYGYGYGDGYAYDDDDWLDWLDEQYSGSSEQDTGRTLDQAGAISALRDLCSENLNDYVGALDYSGSSASVRTYVKNLCSRDASAASDVSSYLTTALGALASGDTETAAKDLAKAREEAEQAASDAQTLSKPSDATGDLLDNLDDAADYVSDRWTAMADAIEAVEDSSTLSSRFDRDAEDATEDLLYDGSACLLNALTRSAQQG